jgi:hypothetical protein
MPVIRYSYDVSTSQISFPQIMDEIIGTTEYQGDKWIYQKEIKDLQNNILIFLKQNNKSSGIKQEEFIRNVCSDSELFSESVYALMLNEEIECCKKSNGIYYRLRRKDGC